MHGAQHNSLDIDMAIYSLIVSVLVFYGVASFDELWEKKLDIGLKYFRRCSRDFVETTTEVCRVSADDDTLVVTRHNSFNVDLNAGVVCESSCKEGFVWQRGTVKSECRRIERFVSTGGGIYYNWTYMEGTLLECYKPEKPLPANTCETKLLRLAERYPLDNWEKYQRQLYPSVCSKALVKKGTYCFMACQKEPIYFPLDVYYELRYDEAPAAVCAADHRWEPLTNNGFTAFACRARGKHWTTTKPTVETPEFNTAWLKRFLSNISTQNPSKKEYTTSLDNTITYPELNTSVSEPEWLVNLLHDAGYLTYTNSQSISQTSELVTQYPSASEKILEDSLTIPLPVFYFLLTVTTIAVLAMFAVFVFYFNKYKMDNMITCSLAPPESVQRVILGFLQRIGEALVRTDIVQGADNSKHQINATSYIPRHKSLVV